jgi:DNA-binding beta-propeller fold protein YncE
LRTDLQYNPNALQFFPPHVTAYDSVHKRFFMSNTTQNRIDVFDATQESQIGIINVPLPWGMDVSPDGTKLYVATTFGDVYLIDPAAMQVLQRFPSATIGPQGYTATQVFILADGSLALLGALGGFYFDGSPDFAVWNPANNTIAVITDGIFRNLGQITLTADRTKVIVGGATSQKIKLYDPSANTAIIASFIGGNVEEILPTPDGKRIVIVGLGGGVNVFDASTLSNLGTFENIPGSSAVLSQDGSTLYTVDLYSNVFAWDTTTFAQKGWVSSFDVVDLQQSIVAAVTDDTGLIFGPIGHGVAFMDASKINPGQQGTQFNIGFLSPATGPNAGATALQTEILTPQPPPNITTGTVYIGNAPATNISLSATSFSGDTPPAASGGAADFTVVLPDNSIRMMPEDFSYGPTIVEVSPNAASAEGGGQGVIFGYGFGQQASDVQVSIDGQAAQVTQLLTNASPNFPYPFLMEAVLFTVPPGAAGTSESVTVQTANGSATASSALFYIPTVQSYPLPGASLMQGIYDSYRGVLYYTSRAQVEVFSPASESWGSPITLPSTNNSTRLTGIALSPDGNALAVSDSGNNRVYVLNPNSPNTAKYFGVNTGVDVQPYGLAVTNTGAVYYATQDQNAIPPGGFNRLDTNTGVIANFEPVKNGDSFVRVLLTPDGKRVFVNDGPGDAGVWMVDTSTDSLTEGLQVTLAGNGNEDSALSGDGSVLLASDLLTDSNLNVAGDITYLDRDVWLPVAVYGQKLNSDGSLVFQPLTNGIDVLGGSTGLLQHRVALSIPLSNVYDALAVDGKDNFLFAITSNGIAQVNLSTLPASATRVKRHTIVAGKKGHLPAVNAFRQRVSAHDWPQRPSLHRPGTGGSWSGADKRANRER